MRYDRIGFVIALAVLILYAAAWYSDGLWKWLGSLLG
jgi:hypothetical protein